MKVVATKFLKTPSKEQEPQGALGRIRKLTQNNIEEAEVTAALAEAEAVVEALPPEELLLYGVYKLERIVCAKCRCGDADFTPDKVHDRRSTFFVGVELTDKKEKYVPRKIGWLRKHPQHPATYFNDTHQDGGIQLSLLINDYNYYLSGREAGHTRRRAAQYPKRLTATTRCAHCGRKNVNLQFHYLGGGVEDGKVGLDNFLARIASGEMALRQ